MTIANESAASARKGDYAKAASLYDHAAIKAELEFNEAKAERHRKKSADYARRAYNAEARSD
jgi:hypothetical protein